MKRWKLAALGVGIAVAAGGSAALAGVLDDGSQQPEGPAVVVTGGGATINAVRISTQDAAFATNSTSFVTPPGAVVGVPVAPNTSVVITADFTAETACS